MDAVSNNDQIAKQTSTGADEARVRVWLDIREPLERQLEPLGRAAIDRLHLNPGDRVLDIGFGIGSTPLALARIVGPRGEVVGIDVLKAALDVMRSDAARLPNVSFVHGDAEVYSFPGNRFDAAFSRFGVMFFSDPVAAFANICRALRPGGRLVFVCWRGLADNELDELPIRAAAPCLPPELVNEAQHASHFSFADPVALRTMLARAGYTGIDIYEYNHKVSSGDLGSMVDVCSRVGSLGAILRQHPELRLDAVAALGRALATLDGPEGPALRAAIWIVTAFAPHAD